MKDIVLDFQRSQRTGLEEAIFCANKTPRDIEKIIEMARERGTPLLLTRLEPERWSFLNIDAKDLDYDEISHTAFLGEPRSLSNVTVFCLVTAGSSDRRVAQEAVRTFNYYGYKCATFSDLGVAGLWRLTERVNEIALYPIVLVVAGMDAAMPTVLSGLISSTIIGIPTSNGYGAADGGRTALNAMLVSCSPGIAVVNIDNGFGAACVGLRLINSMGKLSGENTDNANPH